MNALMLTKKDKRILAKVSKPYMRTVLYPFMMMAAIGFVLSLATHLMALAGKAPPGGGLVWGLHIGIFAVWIPTVLISKRKVHGVDRKLAWKTAVAGCPVWMSRALQVVSVYAVVNFILFMLGTAGHPKPVGPAPASVLRGFSGHWMLFYGAAFTTLYSAIKAPHLWRRGKEPKGHSGIEHGKPFGES
jgi:hypothetical protein